MNRYQIRVPKSFAVEDVVEGMAGKGWDRIKPYLDTTRMIVPLKNYRRFQNAIYHVVTPLLHNYRLCGYPEFCDDAISSVRGQKPDRVDQIFHILLEHDLDQFLDEVTTRALESIENLMKPDTSPAIFSYLREIFHSVLSEYLYWNPLCGKTEFCDSFERAYSTTDSAEKKPTNCRESCQVVNE